jgi:hypothetical protein
MVAESTMLWAFCPLTYTQGRPGLAERDALSSKHVFDTPAANCRTLARGANRPILAFESFRESRPNMAERRLSMLGAEITHDQPPGKFARGKEIAQHFSEEATGVLSPTCIL